MPRGIPLAPGTRERWRREVNPLWAYCRERGYSVQAAARRVALRYQKPALTNVDLTNIHAGRVRPPAGFVEEMCEALERPVAVVMGSAPGWREEFGEQYGLAPLCAHDARQSRYQSGGDAA